MIFLAVLFAHLISDFVLFPKSLAQWKLQSYKGYLVHFSIVLFVTAISLMFVTPYWLVVTAIVFLFHALIDYVKNFIVSEKLILPIFITKHALDIALPLLVVYLVFSINIFSGPLKQINALALVDGILLSAYFAASFIQALGRQAKRYSTPYEIESSYEYLSMVERAALFLIFVFGSATPALYVAIPIIFIPRIYLQRIQIFTKYRIDFVIGTFITFLIYLFMKPLL